jgi:hypothetical protein
VGTIHIKEFTGGLDTRRMPENTTGGVLIVARDGHITRGGEFEKRAAFVPTYTLPAGTVGLSYVPTGLIVYGSDPAPAMPFGVTYLRLQHPDGATALTRVLSDDLYAGKRYAVGEFADGSRHHFYNGVRVTDWFDGRARATFRVAAGVDSGSALSNLTVAGVAVISSPVSWQGSAAQTASAIASAINGYTSSPDYQAAASGDTVSIPAATAGAAANDSSVAFTVAGGLVVTPTDGLVLANGAADTTGGYLPGTFVKTIGSKVYSVSGPNLHFSGIQQPTQWKTDAVGAGFIDMSSQSSGAEELKAIARYQTFIALFSERVIQIEYVDSDPENNKFSQSLENTGTASPRSVTPFGDADLFYCDESGVRSVRARDASNSAATADIGVPVDTLITAKLATFDTLEREDIIGLIEPRDGRFWLSMKDEIFAFSYFAGSKVSAWSTYTPSYIDADGETVTFEVQAMVSFKRRVYVRSGDTVFVYGGMGADVQYDATVAEAWLPYLDAGTPAKTKELEGVDAAVEGVWEVRMAMDPVDLTASDKLATITESTFREGRIAASGQSTHFGLRFRSRSDGPAKLGSAVIHFAGGSDED